MVPNTLPSQHAEMLIARVRVFPAHDARGVRTGTHEGIAGGIGLRGCTVVEGGQNDAAASITERSRCDEPSGAFQAAQCLDVRLHRFA